MNVENHDAFLEQPDTIQSKSFRTVYHIDNHIEDIGIPTADL